MMLDACTCFRYTQSARKEEWSNTMRTQSPDTSPAFEQIQIAYIRTFSAARKFRSVCSWTQSLTSANFSAIDDPSSPLQERDRAIQFVTREYGNELASLFSNELTR